ncbi:MAG: M15 family metallopeptidase [Clostridia bacterium]|nr:M15 family metallopeptidase [Clostridia bacterium]
MDFRPDIDAHLAAKKRQYNKRKKRIKRLLCALLIITILAVWTLIGFIAYRLIIDNSPTPPPAVSTSEVTVQLPEETTPPVTVVTEAPKTVKVTFDKEDIARGNLILVSFVRDAEYNFDIGDDLVTLYGNKTKSYRISSTALKLNSETVAAFNEMFDAYYSETGNSDYQITQAHRTYEEQKSIYDSYLETYGVEMGASLAAAPGYSEHHSGYAVDMNVYTADGISYSLGTAGDINPIYSWIYDHAAEYGFVLRFPEGKTNITGITNEPWHFRYVGKGHASYMAENSLVLEEYIDLLYSYPYDGKHLEFSYGGISYEVFFVPLEVEECEIEFAESDVYYYSGNNVDGIIVTLIK